MLETEPKRARPCSHPKPRMRSSANRRWRTAAELELKFVFLNSLETLIKTNVILKSTVSLQGSKEGHFSGRIYSSVFGSWAGCHCVPHVQSISHLQRAPNEPGREPEAKQHRARRMRETQRLSRAAAGIALHSLSLCLT